MSAPKHTPGPWEAQDREERFVVFGNVGNGDSTEVFSMREDDFEGTREELEANATLIAAAPAMLQVHESNLDLIAKMQQIAEGHRPLSELQPLLDQLYEKTHGVLNEAEGGEHCYECDEIFADAQSYVDHHCSKSAVRRRAEVK